MNKQSKRKRGRTQSSEVQLSKKYRENQTEISDSSSDISDIENEHFEAKESSVTMATPTQSDMSKGNDNIDLNILKSQEGIQQLLKIFEPFLQGLEKKIVSRIDNLEETFTEKFNLTDEKLNKMEARLSTIDRLDQQARQNNLLFCGIQETENEDTNKKIISFVKEKLPDIDIKPNDIEKSFRIKEKSDNQSSKPKRPRPILVKFNNYNTRKSVYKSKNKLREMNENLYINEDLIPYKSSLFAMARQLRKEKLIWKCWTYDSLIFYTEAEEDDKPKLIASEKDIDTIRKPKQPTPSTSKNS